MPCPSRLASGMVYETRPLPVVTSVAKWTHSPDGGWVMMWMSTWHKKTKDIMMHSENRSLPTTLCQMFTQEVPLNVNVHLTHGSTVVIIHYYPNEQQIITKQGWLIMITKCQLQHSLLLMAPRGTLVIVQLCVTVRKICFTVLSLTCVLNWPRTYYWSI